MGMKVDVLDPTQTGAEIKPMVTVSATGSPPPTEAFIRV